MKLSKTQLSLMLRLGGAIIDVMDPLGVMYLVPKITKEFLSELKISKNNIADAWLYVLSWLKKIKKWLSLSSGLKLTNNKIKDIMKIIRFLENRWILLKGTIGKIISRKRGFLNFFLH